ncbi:hypothetical protein FVF58_37450 [Paraburkholderia panacisoli]|uniref:Uncharacterized protein n=1 Tax=Paraburkholderia panacisoli TaxID=2603818 RepID=A0A5B0GL07_9BURK|nr:hypothetical protein [Paraburkholderia panacisoli]KAA1002599.1 hypothetical protein FVF58_37450 [Paraburkholderia panacisoli]
MQSLDTDMTSRVNAGIGFFSFSKDMLFELPEGDVAVHLDGGSHFYEQTSVKIPFPEISITCLTCVWSEAALALVRRTSILTAFYPLAYHQPYPACALRRNHSPGNMPHLKVFGCFSNPV